MRRGLAGLAAVLAASLAVPACADRAPVAARHPCGPEADAATVRVVDVYAATLRHLLASGRHGEPGAQVLYLTDHAVPEFQETGIPEWEKRTPAPASDSTAPFTPAVRRCLEDARFDGLPPIRLVEGWGDPAIRTEQVAREGWPAGQPVPVRIAGGRLFSLGGVPARGTRLALAAGSLAGENDATGGLFVLRHDGRSWQVTGEERHWVT
jgi:hypothetical protein